MEKKLKPVRISDRFFNTIKNSMRELVTIDFDKAMLDILSYVVVNEPVSLYRATRVSPYSISLVYKKAKKMVNLGLIKAVTGNINQDRRSRHLYISTVKGLLVCMSFKCIDKKTFISRLSTKWNIKTRNDLYKLLPVFRLLPYVITQNDVTVLEDLNLLMLNILDYKQYQNIKLSDESVKEAQRIALRCLIGEILNRVINNDKNIYEKATIIGTRDGLIKFDPEKKSVFVYSCDMCNRGCCMVSVPLTDSECKLLKDLKTRIEFIPSLFALTNQIG